ncbi:ATP-dependent zinc metalloprotease FTSH 12, chloroplastic [Olea europaea subsp. europaea]|uniref:ATP-dependent zinc metalloprotease FTSH 12, chloroplastic n=1 Tax=Olea europaea subsp. europaea TaxID=158383 RepID=A0A8S0SHT1_OLEEU|nr:ATP-dependent zinc metalloprotease FTSH 12, chloroplastic [Olea europaea subsp. europaea]
MTGPRINSLGRIDRHVYIGLLDAKQGVQIFGVHSAGKELAEDVDFEKVRKGHSKIYQQDIVNVLDKQLLEGMGVSLEKKRLLAVHEAGHIVLAHLFPRFDWHAFSQLLPGGKCLFFYPREDMVDQDDLEKITKIAWEMAISPMNHRLGLTALTKRIDLVDRPDNPDGEMIKYKWDDPHIIPADMTLEVSELFTRELIRYIEETEELAMKGLMDNRRLGLIPSSLQVSTTHLSRPRFKKVT